MGYLVMNKYALGKACQYPFTWMKSTLKSMYVYCNCASYSESYEHPVNGISSVQWHYGWPNHPLRCCKYSPFSLGIADVPSVAKLFRCCRWMPSLEMKYLNGCICDYFNDLSIFILLTVLFILQYITSAWTTDFIDTKHSLSWFSVSEVNTITLLISCWLKYPDLNITVVRFLISSPVLWMVISVWILYIPHSELNIYSISFPS